MLLKPPGEAFAKGETADDRQTQQCSLQCYCVCLSDAVEVT